MSRIVKGWHSFDGPPGLSFKLRHVLHLQTETKLLYLARVMGLRFLVASHVSFFRRSFLPGTGTC